MSSNTRARQSCGAHLTSILRLGLPLIGGHLAQFAITMTDTVMLGWYSVESLAAVVVAGTFFFVMFIFGSGFAQAVMPLVASQIAQGDDTQVRRTTRMGLWMSAIYACAVMPVFWWSEPVMLMIGQEPQIAADVQVYLRIAGWGIIPALGVMVLKSYLAGLGRTQVVLWVTLTAAILNAFLNYALIFGTWGAPELGLAGSAIASVIVQFVSLGMVLGYALKVIPEHALLTRVWRPDWEVFFLVARLGVPIGFTMLAEVGLFAASTIMMGWLGTIPLAAHGIALNLASATFMIHLGLSNAATIRTGNAFGHGDARGIQDGAVVAIALSMAFALLTIAVFVTIPEPLILLFLDPDEPELARILVLGALLLFMAGVFQLVDAAQVMALGLLRGLQDTKMPMIYAAFSYWIVGVPISYVLGFPMGFGGAGIWAGLAIGLAFAGLLMMRRFWRLAPTVGRSKPPAEADAQSVVTGV
ncbi:MAG: MATE family efflux transporter [Pseudomonadota bacterium]